MRAGSSFLPVTHAVLAGMFGRRPQPVLSERYALKELRTNSVNGGRLIELDLTVEFKIHNHGPVTARELYSDIRGTIPEGSRIHFANTNDEWIHHMNSPEWLSMVLRDGFKVAPESHAKIVDVRIFLRPPFQNRRFWLKWTFGAEGCPMKVIDINQSCIDIERICQDFLPGQQSESEKHQFALDLLKGTNIDAFDSTSTLVDKRTLPVQRPIRYRMRTPPS